MTPNPWTKHYPSEVSPELDKVPYANLPELIKAAVGTYSKTKAFTQVMPNGMNGSLTYAQIDTLSDNFASYLREVVGLKQGDRVAVQMPNCLAYPIVAFGVFKAGLVLVNTNPLYTAPEMIHQFSDSGAVTLVVSDQRPRSRPSSQSRSQSFSHRWLPASSESFSATGAGLFQRSQSSTLGSRLL
jgi:long-chain acyl-CoA synthetase